MNNGMTRPTSEAIRQQAEKYSEQLESILREGKINKEVSMDLNELEDSLKEVTEDLISALRVKVDEVKGASVLDLVQAKRLTFEQMPEDVRKAAISAYTSVIVDESCPSDRTSSKMQRVRMEMLASNIVAGFAKLTSC